MTSKEPTEAEKENSEAERQRQALEAETKRIRAATEKARADAEHANAELEAAKRAASRPVPPPQNPPQPNNTAGTSSNSIPPIVLPPFNPGSAVSNSTPVPNADETTLRSLQSFFQQMWQHNISNDPSVWASDFAQNSKYCYKESGSASRDFIARDRAKAINRWPLRRYNLNGNANIRLIPGSNHAEIDYEFSYFYNGSGKSAQGVSHVTVVVEPINGKWVITEFNETVADGGVNVG